MLCQFNKLLLSKLMYVLCDLFFLFDTILSYFLVTESTQIRNTKQSGRRKVTHTIQHLAMDSGRVCTRQRERGRHKGEKKLHKEKE